MKVFSGLADILFDDRTIHRRLVLLQGQILGRESKLMCNKSLNTAAFLSKGSNSPERCISHAFIGRRNAYLLGSATRDAGYTGQSSAGGATAFDGAVREIGA